MTTSQILESKGYDSSEIMDILIIGGSEDSFDVKTRKEFGLENESIHLFEDYMIGDSDEETLNEIAKANGFDDCGDLLNAADRHLINLCEEFPSKITPKVFSFKIESKSGDFNIEVLTTDGGTPDESEYYILKGDSYSDSEMDQLNKAIENEEWAEGSLEDYDLKIESFNI